MGSFYMLCKSYAPNTAVNNRILSFVRGFSELGQDVQVVFLSPDDKRSRIREEYSHVKFIYMWDKIKFSNRIINKLAEEYNGWRFSKKLKNGDIVFAPTFGNFLFHIMKRKGVKLFHERTEHPDVFNYKGFNRKKYNQKISQLNGLFVISTALKKYFTSLGLDDNKIEIVNMTVDNNRFTGLTKTNSEKYIAYCGTVSNNKDGVDELIKSFAIVHQKHPEVKLYIIGKTPDRDDVSGNLKLIDSLGLKDSIVFTGMVSASDMPQLLKNAAVLALDRPDSLQAQCGFPTKLGEYLLTENPVVVTKVGDIPLFLKDGVSALLSEDKNSQKFASKIIWALEHPFEAAEIGRAGAQVALKEFNYLTETKKIRDYIFNRYSENYE